MKKHVLAAAAALFLGLAGSAAIADEAPEKVIEIYRIAPGQHEAFLRLIALYDQANKEAGVPPRELYVHEDGGSWDFVLIQPAHLTPQQDAAVTAAVKRLGAPQGTAYFLNIRKYLLEHSDTTAEGPTTAADWLKKLDRK